MVTSDPHHRPGVWVCWKGHEALGSGGWGLWDVTMLPRSHITSPSMQASLLLQMRALALAKVKPPCSKNKFRTAKAGCPQEGGELQKQASEGREAGQSPLPALQGEVPLSTTTFTLATRWTSLWYLAQSPQAVSSSCKSISASIPSCSASRADS